MHPAQQKAGKINHKLLLMVISEQREDCGGDDGELPYFSHEVCIHLFIPVLGPGCEQSAAQPKPRERASLGGWEGYSEGL